MENQSVYTRDDYIPGDGHKVGRRIKTLFIAAKRQQLGKTAFSLPTRYNGDSTWDVVGEMAIALKVSPRLFVRAVFHGNKVPGGPFPNQLIGKAAARWVTEFKRLNGDDMEIWRDKLQNFLASTRKAVDMYAPHQNLSPVDILKLPMYGDVYPAVLVCSVFPVPDLLEKYGPKALEEMTVDPGLSEILKKLKLDLGWIKRVPG